MGTPKGPCFQSLFAILRNYIPFSATGEYLTIFIDVKDRSPHVWEIEPPQ